MFPTSFLARKVELLKSRDCIWPVSDSNVFIINVSWLIVGSWRAFLSRVDTYERWLPVSKISLAWMRWFGSSALETKIFAVWSKTDVLVSINSTVFSFPREVIFGSPPVFPGIMGSCSQTLAWWFCPWHLKHLVVLWQSRAMRDFLRQIKHLPCLRSSQQS